MDPVCCFGFEACQIAASVPAADAKTESETALWCFEDTVLGKGSVLVGKKDSFLQKGPGD